MKLNEQLYDKFWEMCSKVVFKLLPFINGFSNKGKKSLHSAKSSKLYELNIITIGDYYRQRYGRVVEVVCSLMVIFSYLGWVGAQITALGLVFNLLSHGTISLSWGMALGTAVVLLYTLYGGMWSVALTDFVQMIIIVLGLICIAWYVSGMAGGAARVLDFTAAQGKLHFY